MKDYLGYQGKTCVVTGAASGMGKATCEMLLDLGAKVYAMDIAEITLPVEKSIKVNLGDKASIDEAFTQLPDHIDRFFGIAGVSGVKTDFKTTVAINFVGHKYIIADYLTQRMQDGGAIALMGSLGGTGWLETREELTPLVEAQGYEATMQVLNEMAGPIIFANSDMASYMSGQHIYIDYGQNAINEYTNPTREFKLVTL